MESDWLAAASFERAHELVSAINTLSIHAKLALARVDDSARAAEVEAARTRLADFLREFGGVLEAADQAEGQAIVGTDPRLGELALAFLAARLRWPQPSRLFRTPPGRLAELVTSERTEDLPEVIASLRDLRGLIEQQAHADVVGLLGEI